MLEKYGVRNNITLGWLENVVLEATRSREFLEHSIPVPVMSTAGWNFSWTGLLGLGAQYAEYTENSEIHFQDPLLRKLKKKGQIQTLSWGYHVGKRWAGKATKD